MTKLLKVNTWLQF